MNITEIKDDNYTDDNDNNIIIEISPLFLLISIIPCALSIICVISISIYRFIKILFNK